MKFKRGNDGFCIWDGVILDTGADWETSDWTATQQIRGYGDAG